jgi:hypothetical protein
MCVGTFQKKLYHSDHATGRAGPRFDKGTVSWNGNLQNKKPDHVTTWIKITVSIYDADGAEQEFSADTSIWIAPLDEAEFNVELPDIDLAQIEDMDFCDYEVLEPKSCFSWGIYGKMGLST